jgi:hypothetical protein
MNNDITTSFLYAKGYRVNSKGEWFKLTPSPVPAIPHTVQKPDIRDGPKGKDTGETLRPIGPVRMVITSFRVRLCDIDNLEPKWIIDAMRYAGVIIGDSPEEISELHMRQVKVDHFIDEHTEITIEAAN